MSKEILVTVTRAKKAKVRVPSVVGSGPGLWGGIEGHGTQPVGNTAAPGPSVAWGCGLVFKSPI